MGKTDLIAGEPRGTLVKAVRLLRLRRTSSTVGVIHGDMSQDLCDTFLRALHRVEGELMYLDVATAPPTERTPEQLAAAAFVELVLRIDKVAHEPPI